ncbi:MAG TPA: hypothetical protein VD971_01730 [Phycisphaerales bacterium]|nr:hypothetical protein [Phycisphaerales bacterium]
MRKFLLSAAAALVIAASAGAQAPCPPGVVCIEGNSFPCGYTTTVTNQDVIIRNVTLNTAACASCSFSVTVINGTLTVESGSTINGNGTNGGDAQPGDVCVVGDQVPATAATPGCSVTLRSLRSADTPVPRPIGVFVDGWITVRGGDGGEGADGNDSVLLPNCGTCGPDNGLAGTSGAKGGSITIYSEGAVSTSSSLVADGGHGGSGGDAGGGNVQGPGNAAGGSNGGDGGTVSIRQVGTTDSYTVVGASANGGNAGNGGDGATAEFGNSSGKAGGNGGKGGSISLAGYAPNLNGGFYVEGGHGGVGGVGGNSPRIGGWCTPCGDNKYYEHCGPVSQASPGGAGGDGGKGGSVTVNSGNDVTASGASLVCEGGDGGCGGMGGFGTSGYHDCPPCPVTCDPICACPSGPTCPLEHLNECPSVASSGPSAPGGNGGAGGSISVTTSRWLNGGWFNTMGGCGGCGANGWNACQVYKCTEALYENCCCVETRVCSAIGATKGSDGGKGGNGGPISLNLSVALVAPAPTFNYCGGGGGPGGDGGNGFTITPYWVEPGAPGGEGGLAGYGGTYSNNTVGAVAICIVPRSDCGPQHPEGDDDLMQWYGEDGRDGDSTSGGCFQP